MLTTVTPASVEPVSLIEAKADLRMTHSADDVRISRQIVAARETVEQWTGMALAGVTYQQWAQDREYTIPLLPAVVDTVTRDSVAVEYTDDGFGVLRYTGGPALVTFTTNPQYVPEALKSAILLLVRREGEVTPEQQQMMLNAALALTWPYRRTLGV